MSRTAQQASGRRAPARRAADALADLLLPSHNPSEAVLGLIVIGSLLAAESASHESYLEAFGSAAVAAALYWVAHSYSNALGLRLTTRRRLTAGLLLRALWQDAALIRGAAIPLLALTVAAIAGASPGAAVNAAVWSAAIALVVIELLAGLRADASAAELALETAVGAAMGIAILSLKIILH